MLFGNRISHKAIFDSYIVTMLCDNFVTDDSPEEAYLRKTVFHVLIDNVVTGLTVRFNAVKKLTEKKFFGCKYPTMCEG